MGVMIRLEQSRVKKCGRLDQIKNITMLREEPCQKRKEKCSDKIRAESEKSSA